MSLYNDCIGDREASVCNGDDKNNEGDGEGDGDDDGDGNDDDDGDDDDEDDCDDDDDDDNDDDDDCDDDCDGDGDGDSKSKSIIELIYLDIQFNKNKIFYRLNNKKMTSNEYSKLTMELIRKYAEKNNYRFHEVETIKNKDTILDIIDEFDLIFFDTYQKDLKPLIGMVDESSLDSDKYRDGIICFHKITEDRMSICVFEKYEEFCESYFKKILNEYNECSICNTISSHVKIQYTTGLVICIKCYEEIMN
jgi:hypothetical protein